MKFKYALVAVASTALVVAPTALPAMAAAEETAPGEAAVAVQAAETGYDIKTTDVTLNASQLWGSLQQIGWRLKDMMVTSATYNGNDIVDRLAVGFGNSAADIEAKKPGTYTIHFFDGNEVAKATLTITDSSAAAAPKLASEDIAATNGGVLLTVMGQGVTNEKHALPAGSFSVGSANKGADGVWRTDVTINSAAIDAYYKPLVPPVAQDKVTYDAIASSLTATFRYDSNAQTWSVETPAKVTFNVTIAKSGSFEFADSATVASADVKGLSADKLIALIKERLVKKAEVNGKSVVDASGFKVMLGTQLRDLQDGKPGTYSIGFMYDGNGYNNETVGVATLVVKQPEQAPGVSVEPTTPAGQVAPATATSNGGDAGATAGTKATKPAKKALPQTGDNALAIVGLFGVAGAATVAMGAAAKRRSGDC